MASNQEEAVKRAIRASGGKKDTPIVQAAYNDYAASMLKQNQTPRSLNSF